MTPPTIATPAGDRHLTGDQIGELLASSTLLMSSSTDTRDAKLHLETCERCAAEVDSLRQSLTLFRQAGAAYAERELQRLPPRRVPVRRASIALEPVTWLAAAAVLAAAIVPLRSYRLHQARATSASAMGTTARPTESDEALLEDIDRELSAGVPAPMQSLVDPTDGTASTYNATSTQRKD